MLATVGTESTSDHIVADSEFLEKNPLLLTGVSLCGLVVLLSTAFVYHRQWKSRQLASKLTVTSTPAHEALLSRADQTDDTRTRNNQQSSTATANDLNEK